MTTIYSMTTGNPTFDLIILALVAVFALTVISKAFGRTKRAPQRTSRRAAAWGGRPVRLNLGVPPECR